MSQAPQLRLRTPGFEAAAATHVGRVRPLNEDRFVLQPWGSQGALLAAVFDGMGGQGGGDVAAELAAQALAEAAQGPLPPTAPERFEALLGRLYEADRRIHQRGSRELGLARMGTTALAALFSPEGGLYLYAGDSRLYHFRGGRRVLQSRPHTLVQVLVELGQITEAQGASHPLRARLTSCLGGSASQPGALTLAPPWPGEGDETGGDDGRGPHLRLEEGDLTLLCSDGLWGELDGERLDALVGQHGQRPGDLVEACLEAALEAGGRDNVTVIAVRTGTQRPGEGRIPGQVAENEAGAR